MREKRVRYEPLDRCVLAVAVEGEVKDWSAYVGAVKGDNHEREFQEVAERGTKLPYSVARVLFPDFDRDFTWRP